MTDPDRLAEIKAKLEQLAMEPNNITRTQLRINLGGSHVAWLVAEVERLRDLLARLQWAGTHCERDREMAACPVCDVLADSEVVGQQPHAPDCWLAAELRKR